MTSGLYQSPGKFIAVYKYGLNAYFRVGILMRNCLGHTLHSPARFGLSFLRNASLQGLGFSYNIGLIGF